MTNLLLTLGIVLAGAITWLAFMFRFVVRWRWLVPALSLVMVLATYCRWGELPLLWQQHQAQLRHERTLALLENYKSPDDLISKMEASVSQQPQKAQGWYLLGRLYMTQQHFERAEKAFEQANHFTPDKLEYQLQWVQASFLVNNQKLSSKMQVMLHGMLNKNTDQLDVLNFLALDAFHRSHYQQATEYWMRMLPQLQDGSETKDQVLVAVAEAQKRLTRNE